MLEISRIRNKREAKYNYMKSSVLKCCPIRYMCSPVADDSERTTVRQVENFLYPTVAAVEAVERTE